MAAGKLTWHITFILLICLVASGCGNMTIVKRKHLPGFHVDRSTPPKTLKEKRATVQPESHGSAALKDAKPEQAHVSNDRQEVEAQLASIEPARPDLTAKPKVENSKPIDGLFSTSLGKTQKDKVSAEFRRAVFGPEEDDRKWNPLGIISLILGVFAVALLLAAGILLFITDGSNNYGYIFIGAGIAIASAMVTGAIGFVKKKFKAMKGRGLAFGGFFSGVLSLVLLLIGIIVQVVMLIIEILS